MAFRFVVTKLDADPKPFQDRLRDAIAELRKFQQFVREARSANIQLTAKEEKELAAEEKRLKKEILKAEQDLQHTRQKLIQDTGREALRQEKLRVESVQQAQREVERLFSQSSRNVERSLQQVGAQFREANDKATLFTRNFARSIENLQRQQLNSLQRQLSHIGNQLAFFGGVAVGTGVGGVLKLAIDVNREYEKQETTLAAVLSLTTKLVDQQGKELDVASTVTANFEQARETIELIRKEAAKTILEGPELISAFSKASGLAREGGIQRDEDILRVISPAQQLLKAFGLGQETQVASELRALFTGRELERSTVAQVLQIRKEDIDNAIRADKLFDLLNDKLKAAGPIIKEAEKNFDAIFATLISQGKELARQSFEKTFEKLTGKIGDFNKILSDENVKKFAENISERLVDAFDAVEKFLRSDTFKSLKSFFDFLVGNAETLLKIFIAFKGAQIAGAGGAILQGLAGTGGILAGTRVAASVGALGARLGPIGLAGAAGFGIGTIINEQFENTADRQELTRAEQIERENQRFLSRNKRVAHRFGARDRVSRARSALGAAEQGGFHPAIIENRRKLLEDALRLQQETEENIRAEIKKTDDDKKRKEQEGVRRESRTAEEKARKRREEANQERLETARQLADLTDDRERAIRAQAELDKLAAAREINDKRRAREVIKAIDARAVQDLRKLRREQELETRELEAQATGNEFLQRRLRAEARVAEIQESVRDERLKSRQIRAVRAELARLEREDARDLVEQAQELATKIVDIEKDAATQRKTILNDLAENEKRRERQLREQQNLRLAAERRFARESRRLARETTDAQHDLNEALKRQLELRQDLELKGRERGLRAEIANRLAAVPAPFATSVQGAGGEVLSEFTAQGASLRGQILRRQRDNVRSQFPGLSGGQRTQLAEQQTTQILRDLVNTLLSEGGLEQAIKQLQELGVTVTPALTRNLSDLAIQAGQLREEQKQITDQREIGSEQRSRRESARSVTDAQERLDEARQREIEARTEYNRSLTEINTRTREIEEQFRVRRQELIDQFSGVARNFERSLINLRQEAEKLVQTFQHMGGAVANLPAPLRGLAAPTSFPSATPPPVLANSPLGAGGGVPTGETTFSTTNGPISVVVNIAGQTVTGNTPGLNQLFEEFGRRLEREIRNIPTRR